MNKLILLLACWCCAIMTYGCKWPAKKTLLSEEGYRQVLRDCPAVAGQNLTLYYFDGDCSFCVGKVADLEKSTAATHDSKAVFIAKTHDPSILQFNIKQFGIRSCLIIEKDQAYSNYFRLNEVVKINQQREMEHLAAN